MRRACAVLYLAAGLWVLPFPNPVVAPGYAELPHFHVPSLEEAAAELPPPVSRTLGIVRNFFFVMETDALFLAGCLRRHLLEWVAFSDTPFSIFR